jgi:hypothetical protein
MELLYIEHRGRLRDRSPSPAEGASVYEEYGLKPAAPNGESASMVDGTAAVKKATVITDIRLF